MNNAKFIRIFLKAVVAVVIALSFILPGSAIFIYDNTSDTKTLFDWYNEIYLYETGGSHDTFIFGESESATDGLDFPPIDIEHAPFPPPYLAVYSTVENTKLAKDTRFGPANNKTWSIDVHWVSSSFNPTNIQISWDPNGFDGCEYNSILLMRYDPFDEEWEFAADMLTDNNYSYSSVLINDPRLIDHFQINATVNNPPDEPSEPYPEDGAEEVSVDAILSWSGGDPDPGDTVTYDVYFGTISPPPLVVAGQSDTMYDPGTMNYEIQYYWKIVSWDNHGASNTSDEWDFTTEILNEPPYPPSEPQPPDLAVDVDVNMDLSWTGGDPDPGDTVTYDVYFGTISPPPLVVTGQSDTMYDPGPMTLNTQYFWRIVSWDSQGESTEGSIWSFTTIRDTAPPETTCELEGEVEDDVYISDVVVTLEAIDDLSGINYTKYKLDDSEYFIYNGSFIVSEDGEHIVYFYSVDHAGNIEDEKTCTFTIEHPCYIEVEISGGFGVNAVVRNFGEENITDLEWSITLDGGLVLFGREKAGVIENFPAGNEITIRSCIFGVGRPTITVSAGCAEETVQKILLLFLVVGK